MTAAPGFETLIGTSSIWTQRSVAKWARQCISETQIFSMIDSLMALFPPAIEV